MEKADIIIAVVGVVALTATLLGVIFYEELAGEQEVVFEEMSRSIGGVTGESLNGPTNFAFLAGDNATMASFDITIHFTGQAVQGGTATVGVEITSPNGTTTMETFSMAIASQATSSSATYTVDLPRFYNVPADTSANPNGLDMTHMWAEGYSVRIEVTPPADTTIPVIGAGASYSFATDIAGSETYYEHRIHIEDAENV